MSKVVFITGNQGKAEYLSKYLNYEVDHMKIDLDEIQSLDLREIVEHKVKQAYEIAKRPVIVEDVSLEFEELGKLPGPFIKWFLDEMTDEDVCALVRNNRGAMARCAFGYYDGETEEYFESSLHGEVAKTPSGSNGFGWDRIFIPEGYTVTRAELDEKNDELTYLKIKPFAQLKEFLEQL